MDHEGRADRGGHGYPALADLSVNIDKCTAVRTRAMNPHGH